MFTAPFLSQHTSHKSIGMILKILRVCDRNRLPWILEHRHTAQFFDDPRLQSLVELSSVIVHVPDHCQYGRRWRMTTGFLCGNIDQRDTERLNRRCHGKRGTCSLFHLRHLSLTCHNSRKSVAVDNRLKRARLFEQNSRTCTCVPTHLLISVYIFCDVRRSTAIICASLGTLCMGLEAFLGESVLFGSMAHHSSAATDLALI